MLFTDSYIQSDNWMESAGPDDNIVVSSRARLARNIDGYIFPPHADEYMLKIISDLADVQIMKNPILSEYTKINLSMLQPLEKRCLRESRLISKEFASKGYYRVLYLSPDRKTSLMINEEDHLRMQTILPGYQLKSVLETMLNIDKILSKEIKFAFSPRLGYLTTCPTNLGTGLRLSLLVHLPGISLLEEIEGIYS